MALSHLNCCYSFSHHHASLVESGKKKESQRIDNLLVLATYWFDTLVKLSSQVNGPVTHRSTR